MEFSNINSTHRGDVRKDGTTTNRSEVETAARRPSGDASQVVLSKHAREILRVSETNQRMLDPMKGQQQTQIEPDQKVKPGSSKTEQNPANKATPPPARSQTPISSAKETPPNAEPVKAISPPTKEDIEMAEMPMGSPIANRKASGLARKAIAALEHQQAVESEESTKAEEKPKAPDKNHLSRAELPTTYVMDGRSDSKNSEESLQKQDPDKPGRRVRSYRSAADALE